MSRFAVVPPIAEVGLLTARLLQAAMAIELIGAVITHDWWVAFIAGLALATSFLPAVLERNTRIHLPVAYQVVLTAFIFATLVLGETSDFYWRFWWWDMALHTLSGMILGLTAFLILFTLFDCDRVRMHPALLSALSVCIATTVGTAWEVFEFAMDQSFQLNMQRATLSDASGLADTMSDMIVNFLGAVAVVGVVHWRLTHKRGRRWVKSLTLQFVAPAEEARPRHTVGRG